MAINAGAAALYANNEPSAGRCRQKKRVEGEKRGDVGCEDGLLIAVRTSEWQGVGKSQVKAVSRCPGLDSAGRQHWVVTLVTSRIGNQSLSGRLAGQAQKLGGPGAPPPRGAAVVERGPTVHGSGHTSEIDFRSSFRK